MARPTTLQFGFVTMYPRPVRFRWTAIASRWSALISGTSSGTSGAIRWLREFEMTACPCDASRVSTSPATLESSPENWMGAESVASAPFTVIEATASGSGVARRQVQASRYDLPAERSEATSSATSNHGWSASSWMKRWPTAPVAPSTPTGIFFAMVLKILSFPGPAPRARAPHMTRRK